MTHRAGDPPVGSVAEEAARLIGLLCGDPSDAQASEAGARASARSGACPTCGRDASMEPPVQGGAHESVCRYCPVCHLVSFVRDVSPEIIDRIADVLDLVGGGLRDFADSQRGCSSSPPPPSPPPPPEGPADSPP